MTSIEFVTWLKGFTEGVHEFNVTPKQWDTLKEKLAEVKDPIPNGFSMMPSQEGFSITPAKEGFGYYYVSTTNCINPKKEILND
jgi:hypothetical protein